MGSLSRLGDGRYRLRVELARGPDGARRQHSETCRGTRSRCTRRLAALTADPAEAGSREPFAVYIRARWLPHYAATWRASSYRTRRIQMEHWWLPELGETPLGALDAARIERALLVFAAAGASPTRRAALLTCLGAALAQAVRWGLLAANPAQRVTRPRSAPAPRRPPWSAAQFAVFLAGQEGVWRVLWLLLAGTGMRVGEARALRWADVDLDAAAVTVRRTWARGDGGEYESAPKSAAGRRLVVIGPALTAVLRAWRAEQAAALLPPAADGWVLAREDGSPLPATSVATRFAAAAAGLPAQTVHGLRHLAVTAQLAAGAPLKVVSARIGHSSLALTADLYGHVLAEHQGAAALALDALIGAGCAPDAPDSGGAGGESA